MTALCYIGMGDETGYGIAARNLVRALRGAGADVQWIPMMLGPGLGYRPAADIGTDLPGNVIVHTVPEYYPYWLSRLRARAGGHSRIWGHTVWETDRLPLHWPQLLNAMDGLIVPSRNNE